MELDEAIRRRRMCRAFSSRPVPAAVVDRLLDRARRAPSAGNAQGWAFLVLDDEGSRQRFWRSGADPEWLASPDPPGLLDAPVIVVPLCSSDVYLARYSEPDKLGHGLTSVDKWPAPFWTVDVSFATMLLLLGAVEEDLGALFFGLRQGSEPMRREFGIPADWEPIGAIALGWPADRPGPAGSAWRGRRKLEEITHRGHW
jgi:nitroreductase